MFSISFHKYTARAFLNSFSRKIFFLLCTKIHKQLTEVLYLSYDGMTDPLGQSQVIPYLAGLSRQGYHFHLVSFEKKAAFHKEQKHIADLLHQHNIVWHPLSYTKKPPIISTMRDLSRMKKTAFAIAEKHDIKIAHCRSYISGLAGLALKKAKGTRFLFDMRGFYADERVDGKLWDLSNPVYKAVFNFFKQKEKEMLGEADAVVCLTENGKGIIDSWKIKKEPLPLSVIPCCADLEHFNTGVINHETKDKLHKKLALGNAHPVISYLGAIGTWYMLDEMLDFFKVLMKKYPEAIFLFITHEHAENIYKKAGEKGIPEKHLRILSARRNEVPTALSLSDISLFFIKPTFSKRASSPTKQGEIMGMGIPIICNSGVGDTDLVIEKYGAGIAIDLNKPEALQKAVDQIEKLKTINPDNIVKGAQEFYSLESGVAKYAAIYRKMVL